MTNDTTFGMKKNSTPSSIMEPIDETPSLTLTVCTILVNFDVMVHCLHFFFLCYANIDSKEIKRNKRRKNYTVLINKM